MFVLTENSFLGTNKFHFKGLYFIEVIILLIYEVGSAKVYLFLNFRSSNEKIYILGFFLGGWGVGFWGFKNLFYILLLCVKSFFIEF